MIALLVICFVAAHVAGVWLYVRHQQAAPDLGEAYREENINPHSDPL